MLGSTNLSTELNSFFALIVSRANHLTILCVCVCISSTDVSELSSNVKLPNKAPLWRAGRKRTNPRDAPRTTWCSWLRQWIAYRQHPVRQRATGIFHQQPRPSLQRCPSWPITTARSENKTLQCDTSGDKKNPLERVNSRLFSRHNKRTCMVCTTDLKLPTKANAYNWSPQFLYLIFAAMCAIND